VSFASHDVTNALATYGLHVRLFFLLPLVCIHVALNLARREDPRPYRALSLAVAIDYAVSLPFFLFFPVPERWAVFESEAMLLSDKWSDRLIEAIRPMSGLDNSFPSNHVLADGAGDHGVAALRGAAAQVHDPARATVGALDLRAGRALAAGHARRPRAGHREHAARVAAHAHRPAGLRVGRGAACERRLASGAVGAGRPEAA
jgi:hypothetical protein